MWRTSRHGSSLFCAGQHGSQGRKIFLTNKNSRGERPMGTFRLRHAFVVLACLWAVGAGARDIRVGVVEDGARGRPVFSAASIERAIIDLASAEARVVVNSERFVGDWSLEGAAAALDRALADRDVDVVITIGILGSQQAARREKLAKPVIAPLVIDPILQNYPLIEGHSGRRN